MALFGGLVHELRGLDKNVSEQPDTHVLRPCFPHVRYPVKALIVGGTHFRVTVETNRTRLLLIVVAIAG